MLSNNNLYTRSNNMTLGISKIQKKRAYPGVQIHRLEYREHKIERKGKRRKREISDFWRLPAAVQNNF